MRIAVMPKNFLPQLDGVTHALAPLLAYPRHAGRRGVMLGPAGAPEVCLDEAPQAQPTREPATGEAPEA